MNKKLNEPSFRFLPINNIKPEGWLYNQLKIQAQGLSGNLDKFWPDIKDSKWIGGSAEGWERLPYWLDGFIPLAWLLNDDDMKRRAHTYVNYIIQKQTPDGWLCPVTEEERPKYDMWAMFLILKVLVVYHDAANDERIEEVIKKALIALDRHIDGHTLFNWAHTRWFEVFIPIWWLYERTSSKWLLNLASKLRCQGFDWNSFFKQWPYQKPDKKGRWSQMSHIVNNTMAVKAGVLLWRMTGSHEDLTFAQNMIDKLNEYHGMVTGVFTGDECLSGKSPVQGSELCSVAEYMYSLEHVLSISGDAHWGDILEKIAFNALPATFSPDMWTHQYDQQVNQPQCSRQKNPVFFTNGGESNIFGLEPNFGCCTANLSQAWPKFALSSFMSTSDGLAACVYMPCSVNTSIHGAEVSVTVQTNYPFRDIIDFKIRTDKPVKFPLLLRIPEWCKNPTLKLNDEVIEIKDKGFYRFEKSWENETCFTLKLPMSFNLAARPNNLYAVTRGPLVYSLLIGEKWQQINKDLPGRQFPHCDYEIYPITGWNYGLIIDKETMENSIGLSEKPIGKIPFSPEGPPVEVHIKGKKVDWALKDGVASSSPDLAWISEEKEDLTLIPYGCTNIRMTEMPVVSE